MDEVLDSYLRYVGLCTFEYIPSVEARKDSRLDCEISDFRHGYYPFLSSGFAARFCAKDSRSKNYSTLALGRGPQ